PSDLYQPDRALTIPQTGRNAQVFPGPTGPGAARDLFAGPGPAPRPGAQADRRASSASPAARIASTGTSVRPVISSTCRTVWWSSMAKPPTTVRPASCTARASGVGQGA